MAEVQRGNVILTIPEEDIEKYMAKGFSVINGLGNVIRQSVPTELGQLQKAFSEHTALLKAKDSEIAELKAEIERLKSAGVKKTPAAKSKDEESWDDWESEAAEEKPAKKTKK